VYELALAQMELQALGVDFQVTNSLREFRLLSAADIPLLTTRLAYFKSVGGEPTDYLSIIQKNRMRSVNQYLTHWIYPYKGKFHPQMIRALINIIGLRPGETLLDPFIGSGTAAVEAVLLGVDCLGFDISPLCVAQSRVKVECADIVDELEAVAETVLRAVRPTLFDPSARETDRTLNVLPDGRLRNFFKIAELIAHSDQARRRKRFDESFIRNVHLMLASARDFANVRRELELELGRAYIYAGDARHLPVADATVDGIITSPPYSIALDYVANDAHALRALGCDLDTWREMFIGVRGRGPERIRLYNEDLRKSIKEMARVLRDGKYCVIVIGNATYQGDPVPTVQFTIDECGRAGLALVKNVDKIIFGLYNVMQSEKILIFQKPD
jgi:SAM-dependent methyltransferase